MNNGAKCKDLRRILRDIDPELDIDFNFDREEYTVFYMGNPFRCVPYGSFTRETAQEIRRTLWTNINGDVFAEVDEANDRADRRRERNRELMSEALAKDIRKPLIRAYEGC